MFLNNSFEDDFNKKSKPLLNKVYDNEVKLDCAHLRKRILNDLLGEFANYTKTKDPAFNVLFANYLHTGSAFEGLQVKKVDEFDIDIKLIFPSALDNEFCLIEESNPESYGAFKLKRRFEEIIARRPDKVKLAALTKFFDNEGFLINDNVRFWCQSLVDHFINIFEKNSVKISGIREIKACNSGPARTLKIRLFDDELEWISVDLVPVFVVRCDGHLKKITYHDRIVSREHMKHCVLVPKPLKNSRIYKVEDHKMKKLWRFHFPEAEESIMNNKGCLKTLIKLVKCLRDKENFSLPSYFIKMVAFHMVREHPNPEYFHDFYLGIRFLQMIKALWNHLKSGKLDHIFYPKFNLFEKIEPVHLSQITNRVGKIYEELERNPNSIKSFFKSSRYQ